MSFSISKTLFKIKIPEKKITIQKIPEVASLTEFEPGLKEKLKIIKIMNEKKIEFIMEVFVLNSMSRSFFKIFKAKFLII